MALAIREKLRTATKDSFLHIFEIDFDSSYPANGEPLSAADLKFSDHATQLIVIALDRAGYSFSYDGANAKIQAWALSVAGGAAAAGTDAFSVKSGVLSKEAAGATHAPLREVQDTANLATLTGVVVLAFGKKPIP